MPHSSTKSILCLVNHYYGPVVGFKGKSSWQVAAIRKAHIENALAQLRTLGNIEIGICGIKNHALTHVTHNFDHLTDPRLIVYESLSLMTQYIGSYDYYINIECDIYLPEKTLLQIIEFDQNNPIHECFHPNRIEIKDSQTQCIDTVVLPGWTQHEKKYKDFHLKVALNPHSGILILSDEKLRYLKDNVDTSFREQFLGGLMASAYAHFHTPFLLYRSFDDPLVHHVVHLDHWEPEPG